MVLDENFHVWDESGFGMKVVLDELVFYHSWSGTLSSKLG